MLFVAASCVFLSACVSQNAAVKQRNSFMLAVPNGAEVREVNPSDAPTLFQYLMDSDYVAIALTRKATAIGQRVKSPTPNMAEWMVGTVNHFHVEELLFAKEQFYSHTPSGVSTTRTFETFKKMTDWKETYKENTRYLLFLKEISKTDEIFVTLDLDKEKNYYRPYKGTKSIFPDTPDPMHGTNNVGRIDLSTDRYAELIEAIRQLCEALSPKDDDARVHKLEALTKSDNKVLSVNAKYAIEYLSKDKPAENP